MSPKLEDLLAGAPKPVTAPLFGEECYYEEGECTDIYHREMTVLGQAMVLGPKITNTIQRVSPTPGGDIVLMLCDECKRHARIGTLEEFAIVGPRNSQGGRIEMGHFCRPCAADMRERSGI